MEKETSEITILLTTKNTNFLSKSCDVVRQVYSQRAQYRTTFPSKPSNRHHWSNTNILSCIHRFLYFSVWWWLGPSIWLNFSPLHGQKVGFYWISTVLWDGIINVRIYADKHTNVRFAMFKWFSHRWEKCVVVRWDPIWTLWHQFIMPLYGVGVRLEKIVSCAITLQEKLSIDIYIYLLLYLWYCNQ